MTIRKIVSVLVPLFIGIVVFPIVYSWDNSDVRGWWPFLVFFGGLSILPYTGLFFLIEKIRASSPRHIFLYSSFVIDDRIHFGISYKMAVRNFIRVFRKKYLSRKAFGARFTTKFDFHLILKY